MTRLSLRSLRGAFTTLKAVVLKVDSVGDLTLEELVEFGHILWAISTFSSKALSPVKDALRDAAISEAEGKPGPVEFESGCTSVRVLIQEPRYNLRKGTDVESLREVLGEDLFGEIFSVMQSVRVDTEALDQRFGTISEEKVKALLDAIEPRTHKPRVSFK